MHVPSPQPQQNKGFLTAADEFTGTYTKPAYHFDKKIYENRVFDSKGVADPSVEIQFGPNIKDWLAKCRSLLRT